MHGCDSGGSGTLNPTITDIQPESGPPGTAVTISGSDFSPNPADNSVTIGGTPAPVKSASKTEIETEVPEGIGTGEFIVQINVDGNTASLTGFTVLEVLKDQIAFTSDRDGGAEIFVMNADGTGIQQITNNSSDDHLSRWSPNGNRFLFWSEENDSEIMVINSDGTGIRQLTDNSGVDNSYPSWSPNGSEIVSMKFIKLRQMEPVLLLI